MGSENGSADPAPPDDIPQYVADGIRRQDEEVLEQIIDYTTALMDARSQAPDLVDIEDGDGEIVDAEQKDGYTEVIKKVTCGKDCNGCPHGPYVYRVRYSTNGLDWDYVGPLHEVG